TIVVDRDVPTLVSFQETDVSPADGKQDKDALLTVTGTIASSGAPSPLNQPATVFNRTTGASWTAFADATGAFSIAARASSGDRLEIVLNNFEVGVVATLSFGLQGIEVNRTMHKIGEDCGGGPDTICPAKTRRLFSFGGKPADFGAPPDVQFCREADINNNCVDLISDLERLNDIDLLPAADAPAVPAQEPLVVGAISRFGLGFFSISQSGSDFQIAQVGAGAKLKDHNSPPAYVPLFAVAASREFPVKPPKERTFCSQALWDDDNPSLAFVAAGSTGVFVVDVTDATQAQEIGLFKISDSSAQANTLSLDAKRGLLYVGMGGEGVVVVDMTDPCTLNLPSGVAPASDRRIVARIPVSNVNVNVPFVVDSDTGVMLGAGDPGPGAPPGSGTAFALSPIDPPLRWVADTNRDGVFEEEATGIPLGVVNPLAVPVTVGPMPLYPPSVVRLLANIMGGAGQEIVLPVSSTSESGVPIPPSWSAMARSKTFVSLKRESDDPADPGYNRYLSPPIVLIADARARKKYMKTPEEDASTPQGQNNVNACQNCSPGSGYDVELADLSTPPLPDNDGHDRDHPIKQAFEQWTGRKLVAELAEDGAAADLLKQKLAYLKSSGLLRVRAELATVPGDLSPDLAQAPRVNASIAADEVGGQVVLSSGEFRFQARDLWIAGREGNDFMLDRFY